MSAQSKESLGRWALLLADTTYLAGAVSTLSNWGYWPHPVAGAGFLKCNTKSGWNWEQSLVFQIVCAAQTPALQGEHASNSSICTSEFLHLRNALI